MRILVVGAGALGSLVGAHLTEAKENVILLEINQARAKLINDMGLMVSEADRGERCVRIHISSSIAG